MKISMFHNRFWWRIKHGQSIKKHYLTKQNIHLVSYKIRLRVSKTRRLINRLRIGGKATGVKSKEINWILKYRWAICIFNDAFLYNCMDVFYHTFWNFRFLPHLTIYFSCFYAQQKESELVYDHQTYFRCSRYIYV